jgi:type IV pilus biogenesis protein CpaD/CtpE
MRLTDMKLRNVLIIGVMVLTSCADSRNWRSTYQPSTQIVVVSLQFAPGSARLTDEDLRRLRGFVPHAGRRIDASLVTGEGQAVARASSVSAAIGLPVGAYIAPWPASVGARGGTLTLKVYEIAASACNGESVHLQDELWPLTSSSGVDLAPAGCAVQTDLAAMISHQGDLYQGSQLAPASVGPFVDAADRYDRRNLFKPPYGQEALPKSPDLSQGLEPFGGGASVAPATAAATTAAEPSAAGSSP